MLSPVRLSVCRLSVTLVRPTQAPRLHANVGPMLLFRVQSKLWFAYTRPGAVRRSCCGLLDCCCEPCVFPTCRRAPSLFANWTRDGGRFADDRVECTSGVQHWQSDSSDRSVDSIAHLRTQYIGPRHYYALFSGTYVCYVVTIFCTDLSVLFTSIYV